jgi:hypothetical protein
MIKNFSAYIERNENDKTLLDDQYALIREQFVVDTEYPQYLEDFDKHVPSVDVFLDKLYRGKCTLSASYDGDQLLACLQKSIQLGVPFIPDPITAFLDATVLFKIDSLAYVQDVTPETLDALLEQSILQAERLAGCFEALRRALGYEPGTYQYVGNALMHHDRRISAYTRAGYTDIQPFTPEVFALFPLLEPLQFFARRIEPNAEDLKNYTETWGEIFEPGIKPEVALAFIEPPMIMNLLGAIEDENSASEVPFPKTALRVLLEEFFWEVRKPLRASN